MNRASENQWPQWDETAEDAPEEPTAGSRRLLLAGAASGLALAASGLLLPDRLEEVDAREGALGGAKGGRRGKDQRGRHKHRDHGKKKDKGNDKNKDQNDDTPRGLFRGIRYTVSSRRGSYPVEFYVTPPGLFDTGVRLAETKTVSPNNPITLQTGEGWGALWIEGRYFLSAKNVLPSGTEEKVGLWGHIDLNIGWIPGQWWNTGTDLVETTRTIAGARPVLEDDLRYVHFLRRPDSHDYLEFEVYIQPLEP
jgi:hypothetical protein